MLLAKAQSQVQKLPNKKCTTTWLTSISLSEDQRWDFPSAAAAAAASAAGRKAAWLMAEEATSVNEPPGTYNDKTGRLLKLRFPKLLRCDQGRGFESR